MKIMKIYKLDELGLGKGPYKVVGFYQIPSPFLAEQNPSAYDAALRSMPNGIGIGSCAICGTGLTNNFIIESSDGKKFPVGCDCLLKINDIQLITEMKKIQKEVKQKQKKEKMIEQWKALAAKLDLQREANGGLTDLELEFQKKENEELAKKMPLINAMTPLAEDLFDGKNGFCDSIANEMKKGMIPTGRALNIVIDILAKKAGRTGSKAYERRYSEVEEIFYCLSE